MYQTNLAEIDHRTDEIHLSTNILKECVRNRKLYYIAKRIFDFTLSLIALAVLSPLFLILSLLIFIDDPHGSPFFTQRRVGRNDRYFKFYKFRTMVVNAESMLNDLQEQNEKDGPVFKIKNDPRITRIGKFLRRTSLDELPQLINILKGDMSIVGPRPALPREVEKYSPVHLQRLLIKPGLTCYWQASRNRDDISFDEWMELDLKYIRDQSFWLDIKLIFRTFMVILTGQGN